MPAKNPFTPLQIEKLIAATKAGRKDYKNQEDLAHALKITQPSLSAMLKGKWKPGITTAKAIASLSQTKLEDLIGPYGESGAGAVVARDDLPNLEACVRFYSGSKNWSLWTLAAARAGFFGGADVPPPKWHDRLDQLEIAMKGARKALP